MLLYSLLYLSGYEDIAIEDLKKFRQLHSKTAGHPEYGELSGIETTTGPLGQGLANAVGMAIAEKMAAARLSNKIFNHKTYCLVGDGCLMEGISQEAISLAGHLNLNKLIVLWDDNSISIDGNLNLSSSENMKMRFEACNWKVYEIDGHNFDEIRKALASAQNSTQPVLIACKTTIAYGSPNKAGSEKAHGSPLGEEEIKKVREALNWPYIAFEIPENLKEKWLEAGKKGRKIYKEWLENFNQLDEADKIEFNRIWERRLPEDFQAKLEKFKQQTFLAHPKQATRKSSFDCLEFLTTALPELIGGSADLTESVLTKTSNTKKITKDDFSGRYIHYGIREHVMAAVMNGIVLHGGFLPYGGTFLVFSDYMKPAIRLAALMKLPVIYIFTHDSIGLGEDGPTHQPVEHLASLRSIPNLNVFRPADAQEVIGCFEEALKHTKTPSAIILTRQSVDFITSEYNKDDPFCCHGGYIISDTALGIEPDVIIIATGSEVSIAMKTKVLLHKRGIAVRLVSMPCFELFSNQAPAYKNKILGNKNILKVGIEAGIYQGWHRYVGDDGIFIGVNSFGASGKAEDLYPYFGITAENACDLIIKELTARRSVAIKRYKDADDELDEIERVQNNNSEKE
jgi:transketolase